MFIIPHVEAPVYINLWLSPTHNVTMLLALRYIYPFHIYGLMVFHNQLHIRSQHEDESQSHVEARISFLCGACLHCGCKGRVGHPARNLFLGAGISHLNIQKGNCITKAILVDIFFPV